MIEDAPPPPPGDTGELDEIAVKVSRHEFLKMSVGQKYSFSHPDTREPVFGKIYQKELIQNMFNPPDEYIFHLQYER